MRKRQPKVYATLKLRFTTEELMQLRFVADGPRMVKRGSCRKELAEASSLDGIWWRVKPLERYWR